MQILFMYDQGYYPGHLFIGYLEKALSMYVNNGNGNFTSK